MDKELQLICMNLFRAELRYLHERGWQSLCGTHDNRYMVRPGADYKDPDVVLLTHEEALKIQKEEDLKNE